jgi:hypothetical protein
LYFILNIVLHSFEWPRSGGWPTSSAGGSCVVLLYCYDYYYSTTRVCIHLYHHRYHRDHIRGQNAKICLCNLQLTHGQPFTATYLKLLMHTTTSTHQRHTTGRRAARRGRRYGITCFLLYYAHTSQFKQHLFPD